MYISNFRGLNRHISCGDNEFYDMQNLSTEKYPYLSPRSSREKSELYGKIQNDAGEWEEVFTARAVIAPNEADTPEGFCGVIGTDFYYNGRKKQMQVEAVYDSDGTYRYGMAIDETGVVQLLYLNGMILIHGYECESRPPYLYYYNTKGTKDMVQCAEYDQSWNLGEYEVKIIEDTNTMKIIAYHEKRTSHSGKFWDLEIGESVFVDGVMTYSDSRYDDFGDSVVVDAIVAEITDLNTGTNGNLKKWTSTLTLFCTNQKGESPFTNTKSLTVNHVYRKIPYMTRLAVKNGRIWGANPNGEVVYASAFPEFFRFRQFEGVSSDSTIIDVGTQGAFLGVYSYHDTIVAFKKNSMEVIYGNLPKEFAVGKSYPECGCLDENSCTEVGQMFYYLGYQGFYCYNGTRPQLISEALDCTYQKAYGFTDGICYFASAERADGVWELLCYDPRYGIWMKEDGLRVTGSFRYGNETYLLCEDGILKMNAGTEPVEWFAETKPYLRSQQQGCFQLRVLAELEQGEHLKLFCAVGDGDWYHAGDIREEHPHRVAQYYYIPIRCKTDHAIRFRIAGKKHSVIRAIEIRYDSAGRDYME